MGYLDDVLSILQPKPNTRSRIEWGPDAQRHMAEWTDDDLSPLADNLDRSWGSGQYFTPNGNHTMAQLNAARPHHLHSNQYIQDVTDVMEPSLLRDSNDVTKLDYLAK